MRQHVGSHREEKAGGGSAWLSLLLHPRPRGVLQLPDFWFQSLSAEAASGQSLQPHPALSSPARSNLLGFQQTSLPQCFEFQLREFPSRSLLPKVTQRPLHPTSSYGLCAHVALCFPVLSTICIRSSVTGHLLHRTVSSSREEGSWLVHHHIASTMRSTWYVLVAETPLALSLFITYHTSSYQHGLLFSFCPLLVLPLISKYSVRTLGENQPTKNKQNKIQKANKRSKHQNWFPNRLLHSCTNQLLWSYWWAWLVPNKRGKSADFKTYTFLVCRTAFLGVEKEIEQKAWRFNL